MEQISLYSEIFKRKSTRKYDLNPLSEELLSEIKKQFESLVPLDKNIKTEMKIVTRNEVKNLIPIKAPHYIVVFSEEKEGYLTNVGFLLQQMDLYFSSKGLGSCWLGMAKPSKETFGTSHLEFVMILSFGKPMDQLHRTDVSEFKRKSLGEITNITGLNDLLEPARLAPSATNSQPWFFTGNKDIIHAFCVKSNFIKAMLYEKMNKVDMGISLCHIWIAAKHAGKEIDFIVDTTNKSNPPSGYYYILSLKIK